MKKIGLLIFVVSLMLFSCKKETKIDIVTSEKAKEFIIDSVVVKDSVKVADSLSLKYFDKLLVFPSIKEKTLLDSIYFAIPKLRDFTKEGIQAYLDTDKSNFYETTENDNKDWISEVGYAQEWYQNNSMDVISSKNDFLHIRYSASAYMGGAHDNYYFSERVFDLKNRKRLLLSDITSLDESSLSKILMNNIDKIPGGTKDNEGSVANKEMLLIDEIPVTGNFYFDEKNLYFHYSPYEIAAFAAGDITIPVSWEEIGNTIKPEFKKRMNL